MCDHVKIHSKQEYIDENIDQIQSVKLDRSDLFLPLVNINIGVIAKNMLDNFISQNPKKLDKSEIESEGTDELF